MDPLSIFASLAAILQVVEQGFKLCRGLKRFVDVVQCWAKEVNRFSNQVQIFSIALNSAQMSLDSHIRNHPDSLVVKYIRKNNLMDAVDVELAYIRGHFLTVTRWLRSVQHGTKWWAAFQWARKKASIFKMIPQMGIVQGTLELVVSTVHLSAIDDILSKTRKNLEATAQEMGRLRQQKWVSYQSC